MSANPGALEINSPCFVKYLYNNGVINAPAFSMALRNDVDSVDSSFIDFGFINS